MNKLFGLVGVSLIALSSSAQAADMDYDRQIGLIVSGVVDQWLGLQIIDVDKPGYFNGSASTEFPSFVDMMHGGKGSGSPKDQTAFTSGSEGLLSLPLGTNLSIQNDAKYEVNDQGFDALHKSTGPRYWFQGAAHLSWRDPMSGLFGAFGGVGTSSSGYPVMGRQGYYFVGGEGQVYMDNITLYAQGGYVDINSPGGGHGEDHGEGAQPAEFKGGQVGPDDGFFVRGVVRWFPTTESRLQLEATYLGLTSDFKDGDIDTDVWSWKARYDFDLAGLPILGTLPVYLAYRGTLREDCLGHGLIDGPSASGDLVDHTFMVGTSYSFSSDGLVVDRQGATLDTPDLGNMIGCSYHYGYRSGT